VTGIGEWNWSIHGNSGIEIVVGIEKVLDLPTLLFLFLDSRTPQQTPTCAKRIPFPSGGRECE
jgi:hypothetical protein